jgi:hypothetical protein
LYATITRAPSFGERGAMRVALGAGGEQQTGRPLALLLDVENDVVVGVGRLALHQHVVAHFAERAGAGEQPHGDVGDGEERRILAQNRRLDSRFVLADGGDHARALGARDGAQLGIVGLKRALAIGLDRPLVKHLLARIGGTVAADLFQKALEFAAGFRLGGPERVVGLAGRQRGILLSLVGVLADDSLGQFASIATRHAELFRRQNHGGGQLHNVVHVSANDEWRRFVEIIEFVDNRAIIKIECADCREVRLIFFFFFFF